MMSFSHVARRITDATGSAWATLAAFAVIIVWAAAGPLFGYSTTWQLAVNTGTTIVTFIMVFAIQHAQNTDTAAIQRKLDSLVIAVEGADNRLAGIEREAES